MGRAKNLLFLASFVAGTLKLQIEMQLRRQYKPNNVFRMAAQYRRYRLDLAPIVGKAAGAEGMRVAGPLLTENLV